MKTLLISLILTTLCAIYAPPSLALSEYGRTCEDNKECRNCRDKDVKCLACMHRCWNFYGPAELSKTEISRDHKELCRIKWAKWCNAQCWDPDEKSNPDYISTKPDCNQENVFPSYRPNKKPW